MRYLQIPYANRRSPSVCFLKLQYWKSTRRRSQHSLLYKETSCTNISEWEHTYENTWLWIVSSQRDGPMSKSLLLSLETSGVFWLSLLWPCHLSLSIPNILPWRTRDNNIDTTQNIFREEEVRIRRGRGGIMHSIDEMIQPVFKNTVYRRGNKKTAD